MENHQKLLTREEAAEFIRRLGIPMSHRTLAKYASVGGGPEMRRFGRRVLYEPAKLSDWVESRLSESRRSTSELNSLSRSDRSKRPPSAASEPR